MIFCNICTLCSQVMNVFWNTGKIFYTTSLYFLTVLLAIDFSLVFTVDETIQMSGYGGWEATAVCSLN